MVWAALSGLSRNDSVGSVVLARSAPANPSSFARYGPRTGPRLAHSSACERIWGAITFLPTESFRLGSVVVEPTRGVAPGWSVSRRWRSRVMAGIACSGPSRGLVDGWRWQALSGILPHHWRSVFPHVSASLRLGARFSLSPFAQGQRGPSKPVTEGIPLCGRFPPQPVHPLAPVRDTQALDVTPSGSPQGSVGGRSRVLGIADPPSGAVDEGVRTRVVEARLKGVRGNALRVEGGTLPASSRIAGA